MSEISKKWDLIITPKSGWFDFRINQILKFRDLLYFLIKRDYTTFYKQTILGPIWFFIQPILSTTIYLIIFNKVAGIKTDEMPPILFYMSGIILWNYFSNCLVNTSKTFIVNAALFEKVYFPRIIIPLSIVISGLARFFIQFFLFIAIYTYFLIDGNIYINLSMSNILLVPILILQMGILGFGLGIIIAALTTKYRDLSYLVSFGTQLLMYMSPIVYPISKIPENYLFYFFFNPIAIIISLFRTAFLGENYIEFHIYFISIVVTFLILLIGLIAFNKVEKTFIDII